MKVEILTLPLLGIALCTKALPTKHAGHHTVAQAGVFEHALHAAQSTHHAHVHPRHAPGVARHLLDDLKARVFSSLRFEEPGEEQRVR